MAFRKDNKTKSTFTKITIGLASPEEILERRAARFSNPRLSTTVPTSPSATAFSASAYSVP